MATTNTINRFDKINLLSLHISFNLSVSDAIDLRGLDNERSGRLIELILHGSGLNIYDYKSQSKRYFDYYSAKYNCLGLEALKKLHKKKIKEIQAIYTYKNQFHYGVNVTCCDSCHTGTSETTMKEIEGQREKYNGVFICLRCENVALNLSKSNVNELYFTGSAFYKFDWGSRLMNPNEKFLGFGGSKIILKHKKQGIILTNNLFHVKSLSPVFFDKVKDYINTEMHWVKNFKEETLKELLTCEEIKSIKPQLELIEKLGIN